MLLAGVCCRTPNTKWLLSLVIIGLGNCRLSESFEVDGWVVKVSGQSRDVFLKNVICKEMASRVAGYTNQAGSDFHRQPATFDNLETEWIKFHVSLPNDPYT